MSEELNATPSWVDRIYGILGVDSASIRKKNHRIISPNQNELQNEIDTITANYVIDHREFVDIAVAKDAKLKGKPRELVEAMLVTYPGVIAVAAHEVAHELNKSNIVEAEQLASAAKARTGIDISPATRIGKNLFFDHGTAAVIGETAEIGDNTQIMHKVTLGAYTNPKETRPEKLAHRHPVIGDNCFIGPGVELLGHVKVGDHVTILTAALVTGNNIKIGDNVRIGTGAEIEDWCSVAPGVKIGEGAFIHKSSGEITEDVPPHSQVFRDERGKLHVVDGAPDQYRKLRARGIDWEQSRQ